jgi:glutathione synthase/RimK-type ligase-like ATP-grasp enzyme
MTLNRRMTMTSKATIKLVHYGRYSTGGTSLAKGLGITKAKPDTHILEKKHTLINWGCHQLHPHLAEAGTIINPPEIVKAASNKLSFFRQMSGVPMFAPRLPDWTEEADEAAQWVAQGEEVLGRMKLTGKGGDGIIFGSEQETFEDFLECKLFVKYKKKKEEYRVHFLKKDMLDIQQKLLRKFDDHGHPIDRDHVDFRIRNLHNGFIFARNNIKAPDDVVAQATLAFNASGLDFGCVDVIYNTKENQAYVLEINTAPGLMGTTLERYTAGFKGLLGLQ